MKLNINFAFNIDIKKSFINTNEKELKDIPKDSWIVEGFAAAYSHDTQNDMISPAAVKAVENVLDGTIVLYNHIKGDEIGTVINSKFTNDGLFVRIIISKSREDIWEKIKNNELDSFSIAGKCLEVKEEWIDDLKRYVNVIYKMTLDEVSIVPIPANPDAKFITYYISKSINDYKKSLKTKEATIEDLPIFNIIKKGYDNDKEENFYIEGFSTTNDVDKDNEMFSPLAMEGIKNGLLENPTVFYNHDYDLAIGAVKEAKVINKDGKIGVWVKILVSKTEETIITKIKEGVLSGLSIGGRAVAAFQEFNQDLGKAIDIITKFLCYEVSIVGIPCNGSARSFDYYVSKAFNPNNKDNKDNKDNKVQNNNKDNKVQNKFNKSLSDYIMYDIVDGFEYGNENEQLESKQNAINTINGIIEYINYNNKEKNQQLLPSPYPEAIVPKFQLSINEITSSLIGFLVEFDKYIPNDLSKNLKIYLFSLNEEIKNIKKPEISEDDNIINFEKKLNLDFLVEKSKNYTHKESKINKSVENPENIKINVEINENEKSILIDNINRIEIEISKLKNDIENKNNIINDLKNNNKEINDNIIKLKTDINLNNEKYSKDSKEYLVVNQVTADEFNKKIEIIKKDFDEQIIKTNNKIEKSSNNIEETIKNNNNNFETFKKEIEEFKKSNIIKRIDNLENEGGFSKSMNGQESKPKIKVEEDSWLGAIIKE